MRGIRCYAICKVKAFILRSEDKGLGSFGKKAPGGRMHSDSNSYGRIAAPTIDKFLKALYPPQHTTLKPKL